MMASATSLWTVEAHGEQTLVTTLRWAPPASGSGTNLETS